MLSDTDGHGIDTGLDAMGQRELRLSFFDEFTSTHAGLQQGQLFTTDL
jgi:hypothetical protein